MVTPVFMRAKAPKAAPMMNRVKDFATRHWQALFLGLVGVVIVATIVYKYRQEKPKVPPPTDGEVMAKVRALDAKGVERLVEAGGNVDCKTDGICALVVAIANSVLFEKCAKETFDYLVKKDADVKAVDDQKRTVLHHVVIHYHDSDYFLQELFKKKVDLNAVDASGKTPLHYAKDLKVFDLLVANGAKPDAEQDKWRQEMRKASLIHDILKPKGAG